VGGIGISNVLFHTARAAYRAGLLDAVICYGNRQHEIPSRFIRPIRFQPVRLVSFLKARYYYTLKRMALDRKAAAYIRRHGCDIFHGWTAECLRSIEEAKRTGAKTVLERPGPHPTTTRGLLREEYERFGIPFPLEGASRWLSHIDWGYRDEHIAPMEFEIVDRVIVQSDFAVDSFLQAGFPREKLVVFPRAADITETLPSPEESREPFRALFVGTVGIRKGILDLLSAWKGAALPGAELWIVGQVHEEVVPLLTPYRNAPGIRFFGHVKEGAERFYRQASVFVLPSIVEGAAKTTFEAMSAGLPVLTTPNAGSAVRDGLDGFIVPIRDPEVIREKLVLLFENRDYGRELGNSARIRMREFTWDAYEKRLVSLYRNLAKEGRGRN